MTNANRPLINRRILLAVTGSVAACKADRIIRELTDRGADVQVLLTDAGARFFPPETAGSLTERPVIMDQFNDSQPGAMEHIEIKNQTDCILVAPATANRLLNLETPQASDTLGTVLTAFSGPVLYAPAMNPDMWNSPTVQAVLNDYSERVIEPEAGTMACGETGPGRLADPDQIAERVTDRLWPEPLDGVRCVISGGPTREYLDDVRYLTNRSSGKMGEALAKIATRLGADVDLVTGAETVHYGFSTYRFERVSTTAEMKKAITDLMEESDLYVGAAAVADYRPESQEGKISSGQEDLTFDLESTVDIISSLRDEFPEKSLIGFSADDASDEDRALRKADEKGLDAVIFNSINQDDGAFRSDKNKATFCLPSGTRIKFGHRTKLSLALQIWISVVRFDLIE